MKQFREFIREQDEEQSVQQNPDQIGLVFDFFKENPYPKDSQIHEFSKKINLSPDKLEEIVYGILSTFISGGRANSKKLTVDKVDPKELEMGIEVEKEHVDSESPYYPYIVRRIALDHLGELSDYYSKLKVMEGN